jgi:tRNA threonylcarbamoyladenosine biosynthesis protein TsaE
MEIVSKSSEHTYKIGKIIGEKLKPRDILALIGDLGSGKTTFVKGLAEGLDIKNPINSPSFLIIKEYKGKYPFLHIDVYRLKNPEIELFNIGFEEYLKDDYIIAIEWADRILSYLPDNRLEVEFFHISNTERKIIFRPKGERYKNLIEELKECLS